MLVSGSMGGSMQALCNMRNQSSCAIYGDGPELPRREEMRPAPTSPYAASKATGEDLCALFTRVFGPETVSLRYFNVFGPRQNSDSAYAAVIPYFISALLKGDSPIIFGDGEQTRDFVYVDDVVHANLASAYAPQVAGRVFNIDSGTSVSLNALVDHLRTITGQDVGPLYRDARPGDIRHSPADVSAVREIGFDAAVSLDDGSTRTVKAMLGQMDSLTPRKAPGR